MQAEMQKENKKNTRTVVAIYESLCYNKNKKNAGGDFMQKLTAMQQKIYDYIANAVRTQG